MRKLYAFLPALAAVAAVFPATPSHAASMLVVSAGGPTAHCPGATYTSIQSAVNAAASGDTVHVCPGTYAETVTVTTPDLTLEGESTLPQNCDVFAAPNPATDSIIDFPNPATNQGIVYLNADNIRFRGFTVQNNEGAADNSGGFAIQTTPAHSGYVITNNVLQNNPAGIYYNASGTNQSEVAQNCIRLNNKGYGVASAAGNGIYSDMGLDNALIHDNAFFQNKNGAITLDKYQNTLRVTVNRNVSHQDGGLLAIFHSTDSVVTDNQAVDSTGSAIFIGGANSGLQVLRNDIQGSYHGVRSETFFPEANDQTQISNNNIRNTTLGDGISAGPNSLTNSAVSNNSVSNSGHDGVLIEDNGGNGGNTVTGNVLQNSKVYDCEDLTTGTGTAGTANTWTANQAATSNPAGLCPKAPEKPSLTIKKSHKGDFKEGKQGTYTIVVGNAGPGPTNGSTVTVHDVLPAGLTAASLSGTGWTCTLATLTCTRSDVLAAGASYPPITLTANVPCKCKKKSGVDTVTVTGGGDSATHTATDPTTIKGDKHCKEHKPKKPGHLW